MRLIFIVLGFLNYAKQSHGFVLVEPSFTFQEEFSFSVATNMIDSQSHYDLIANVYGNDDTHRIIQEVSYMAKNSNYRSEKWTLKIDRGIGVLEVFVLVAHVEMDTIKFFGGRGVITQLIPPVYSSNTVCARTGNRKYGICGPRTEECNTITFERELNSYEIDLVQKNLLDYVVLVENRIGY
jgi:hypothetical protein